MWRGKLVGRGATYSRAGHVGPQRGIRTASTVIGEFLDAVIARSAYEEVTLGVDSHSDRVIELGAPRHPGAGDNGPR